MGLNRNLGQLTEAITEDAGNIGIGTTPITSVRLNVNGSAFFSSSVTASSLIKIGGTSLQFLKADGSVDNSEYVDSRGKWQTSNNLRDFVYSGKRFMVMNDNPATASTVPLNTLFFNYNNDFSLGTIFNGNVLIGNLATSLPANSKFQVDGNVAIGYTTSAPTNGLIVAGIVAIGNNSPVVSSSLHVTGKISDPQNALIVSNSSFTNSVSGSLIRIGHNAVSGNTTANIQNLINGGTGIGDISFPTGNIAIGATVPNYKLDIQHTSDFDIRIRDTSLGGVVGILFETANNFSGTSQAYIKGIGETGAGRSSLIFGTAGLAGDVAATERMRIMPGGTVLVNTNTASGGDTKFEIKGDSVNHCLFLNAPSIYAGAYRLQRFYANGVIVGNILSDGTSTTYLTTSDYRLKDDLQSFNGLNLISKIKVYDYEWKLNKTRSYGVMAHELQEVFPQATSGKKDGEEIQGVDYSKLVPILVQAVQELKAEIEALKQNK